MWYHEDDAQGSYSHWNVSQSDPQEGSNQFQNPKIRITHYYCDVEVGLTGGLGGGVPYEQAPIENYWAS